MEYMTIEATELLTVPCIVGKLSEATLFYYFSINIYPKDDQKKYIVRKQPINMKDYEEKIPVYMIIAILEKTIGTI